MKKLNSNRINLPVMYLIEDSEELKELPVGIPFIIGDYKSEPFIVKYLEYTLLYRSAQATGLPFKWEEELSKIGYTSSSKPEDSFYCLPYEYLMEELKAPKSIKELEASSVSYEIDINTYLDDGYLVSFDKLTELNVTPTWVSSLADSIRTNVLNSVEFNPSLYSKKLGVMVGYSETIGATRNLGILDFSGSIPLSITITTALLAKLMSKTFYADIMVTGTTTKLFRYEELDSIDLMKEAESIGRNNDQVYFRRLVEIPAKYNTVFAFGDEDNPGNNWEGAGYISDEEGKEICNWEVEKVISLHTRSNTMLAGYLKWFKPKETEHVSNWLKTLK